MKTPKDIRETYDYLDTISQEGWLWEFIRRNEEYRSKFIELERTFTEASVYASDDIYFSPSERKIHVKSEKLSQILSLLERKFGINPNNYVRKENSDSYLVREIKGTRSCIGIPKPDRRYTDISPELVIRGAKPVIALKFRDEAIELLENNEEKFFRYCYKTINKISPSLDIKNTLYLGISLNAKKEDVRRYVDALIEKHCEPRKIKIRPEKWKFYLIVYDLYQLGKPYTYKEIANLLQATYASEKEKKNLFDEIDNVPNWHDNAVLLINKDFQKYMYL